MGMEVYINGAPRQVPEGATVAQIVELLGLSGRRIAVEVNERIVSRAAETSHGLRPADRIEVVNAIGGG